ncbi:MAG TPA: hypothetical protein VFE05_06865 [Longimicrobiaceae bacterium]|jgi:hypothetical protein|nr:hypothetical protein [Longimicrobiaceae bacterium]
MSVEEGAAEDRPVWLTYPGPEVTEAQARIIERTAQWRKAGALKYAAMCLLSPLTFIVPPHIIWPPIVFIVGAMLAWARWTEERTLVSLHGVCPKCGTEQDFTETGRMKRPHTVNCRNCRWELRVELRPPRSLQGATAGRSIA